ncbi:hypothetical protein BDC45DRAFT_514212 [Circinella umbellata]|nr:hypothetical protein BDC45DRAFT_514212 [Circinella umbellata]
MLPPSTIQSKRHSFSEQAVNEKTHLIRNAELQPQQQEMHRRYSIDFGGGSNIAIGESTKIEEEEAEEEGKEIEETTGATTTQKPFDPSYEPVTTGSNNNNNNKIFQIPNTPDDDLVVSTTATRSNSCLSPSTASPATPTYQTTVAPSKIPSPWGSMVSLCLRDNEEDQKVPVSPIAVTTFTTKPQPIVMEEQEEQKRSSTVVTDPAQLPLTDPVPSSPVGIMNKKQSLPTQAPLVASGIPTPEDNNSNNNNNNNEPATRRAEEQQQQHQDPSFSFDKPPRFSYIVASYSLTHQKDAVKTYRRMASKTKNKQVQLAYAKYLLDVARLYEENTTTRQRLSNEGKYWISRLAKKKIWEAVFLNGKHYLEANQHAKAIRCFEKAAKHGYSRAYLALAERAEEQNDWTKALACYRSAADGHPEANYRMAMVLLRQRMNPIQVLQKAARDGKTIESGKAALVLSNIYAHILKTSEHVEKDELKAFRYLKQAFQFDLIEAVHRMGQVYLYGLYGQSKDVWRGYQCFMKAAEEGYDLAMLDLAQVYEKGIQGYLSQQPEAAFRWCQRAAERGLKEAEYTLGTYYEIGVGISIDYPRALEYFGKAASKGHVEAAGKLNLPVAVTSSSSTTSLTLSENSNNKKLQASLMQQQQKHERCYIM